MSRALPLLVVALAAGCSGTQPYRSAAPDNVFVAAAIDSGSRWSSMRGSLHVHEVEAGCRTRYLGTMTLDRPALGLGLQVERPSYLVFSFDGSSFLGGSTSSTSVGTVLKPRPGYRYDVVVTYRDSIYHVVLRESDPRTKASRELPRSDLPRCKA
jgi:hypothetical protein